MKNKIIAALIAAIVAGIALLPHGTGSSDDVAATSSPPIVEAAPVKSAAEIAQQAEAKQLGDQCLSPWDGSNGKFVRTVKDQLNDPNSFEHDRTFTRPVDKNGQNYIKMVFRSRNGFGGMVVAEAIGSFDNQTCEASLKQITPLS